MKRLFRLPDKPWFWLLLGTLLVLGVAATITGLPTLTTPTSYGTNTWIPIVDSGTNAKWSARKMRDFMRYTNSAELEAGISDDTGTGPLVFGNLATMNSSEFIWPTITNGQVDPNNWDHMNHAHQSSGSGGALSANAIQSDRLDAARLPVDSAFTDSNNVFTVEQDFNGGIVANGSGTNSADSWYQTNFNRAGVLITESNVLFKVLSGTPDEPPSGWASVWASGTNFYFRVAGATYVLNSATNSSPGSFPFGSASIPTDTLIHYWRLDDDGVWSDVVGGGTALSESSVSTVAGYSTNAADVTAGHYLYAADSSSFRNGSSSFTLTFWVKPAGYTNYSAYLNKDTGSGGGREFQIWQTSSSANGIGFTVYTNGTGSVEVYSDSGAGAGNGHLMVGSWNFVAVRYNSTNLTIQSYLNGTNSQSLSTTNPIAFSGSTAQFRIGLRSDGLYPANGPIDEVGWWRGVVLTDAQLDYLRTNAFKTY